MTGSPFFERKMAKMFGIGALIMCFFVGSFCGAIAMCFIQGARTLSYRCEACEERWQKENQQIPS